MYTRMCRCKEKCITLVLSIILLKLIFLGNWHIYSFLYLMSFFIYDHGQNMYCEHGLARDWLIFGVCVLVQKISFWLGV